MKKLHLFSIICALCLPITVRADFLDFYGGAVVGAGTNFIDSRAHGGNSYGAMFGVDIPLIRAEAEYNYVHGKRNNDTVNLNIGMLNGYLKTPFPIIKPYIGAGIGRVFGGNSDMVDIHSATAYQGMVGIQFDTFFLPLFIDAETRVLLANGIAPDVNLTIWDARLKLRYHF